jgi:hypothetical protein
MAISRGCSKGYNEHMESSRCHKGKFYLSSFSLLCNTLYKCHCTSFYILSLSLSEVLFSYVLQISKDDITHLIDAGDPCDADDVIKKLFHPALKLLIVTSGSEGCRYYTNVSLPKSFNSYFNCLNRFYNPSFHYFLCSLFG